MQHKLFLAKFVSVSMLPELKLNRFYAEHLQEQAFKLPFFFIIWF